MLTLTIARRELSSLFFSPIAYVVLALFSLGASLLFFTQYQVGAEASLRGTFAGIVWLLIFLAPAISMRLLSEELRSGTMETLATAPLRDMQIVLGKWLGAMGFYAVLLLPVLALTGLLELTADPDLGPVLTGLIGLLLLGGFYLAIGAFASSLTENQIIAFLLTVFIICLFTFVLFFLPNASFVSNSARQVMYYANVNAQFDDFGKGLIDLGGVVYFLSGAGLFLFAAVICLESRRWR